MAQSIEIRLNVEFLTSLNLEGYIHSRFQNIVNIRFDVPGNGFRLISILTTKVVGLPDSITVTQAFFNKISLLPEGSRVQFRKFAIIFEGVLEVLQINKGCLIHSNLEIDSEICESIELPTFSGIKLLDEASKKSFFINKTSEVSKDKLESLIQSLQDLIEAWIESDKSRVEAYLLKLVGYGLGLTPSCDDAIIGIIAVLKGANLYARERKDVHEVWHHAWSKIMDPLSLLNFHELLDKQTTDVSLKYLSCSQEGRFSEPVLNLVKALFLKDDFEINAKVQELVHVGSSSGADTIFGINLALRFLRNYVYEDCDVSKY